MGNTLKAALLLFTLLSIAGCRLLLVNGERWDSAAKEIQAYPAFPVGYFERAIQNHNAWQWQDVIADITQAERLANESTATCPAELLKGPLMYSECVGAAAQEPRCLCLPRRFWQYNRCQGFSMRGHSYVEVGRYDEALDDLLKLPELCGSGAWGANSTSLGWLEAAYGGKARNTTDPQLRQDLLATAADTGRRKEVRAQLERRADDDRKAEIDANVEREQARQFAESTKVPGYTNTCPVCGGRGTVLDYDPGSGTNCSTSYSHDSQGNGVLTNVCSGAKPSKWSSKPCPNCGGTGHMAAPVFSAVAAYDERKACECLRWADVNFWYTGVCQGGRDCAAHFKLEANECADLENSGHPWCYVGNACKAGKVGDGGNHWMRCR